MHNLWFTFFKKNPIVPSEAWGDVDMSRSVQILDIFEDAANWIS